MDVQEESDRKPGEEFPEQAVESCLLEEEEGQLSISSYSGKPHPVVKCVIDRSLLLEKQAAV